MENNLRVIEERSNTVLHNAKKHEITNQVTYNISADFLRSIKALKKEIDDAFDDNIKSAHQLHKDLVAKKKQYYSPIESAEMIVKDKIKKYEKEMERIRFEAEAKARKEAEQKANEEKESLRREAEKAALKGDANTVNSLLGKAEQIEAEPEVVAQTIEKQTGLGIRRNWKFRITDINKIPREYMVPDEVKIGKVVRALKKDTNISGIQVYED